MKILTPILILAAILANQAHAQIVYETEEMTGVGLNGKACSVSITREGYLLKNVILKGASKTYEILSENDDGYGPSTTTGDVGTVEIFENFNAKPNTYQYFTHDKFSWSNGEGFYMNAKKLADSDLPAGMNMKVSLELWRDDSDKITYVKALSKGKMAWLLTVASEEFICEVK